MFFPVLITDFFNLSIAFLQLLSVFLYLDAVHKISLIKILSHSISSAPLAFAT